MDIAMVSRRGSLAMAIGCLAVGLLTPILATEDPGVRLDVQGDRIVVTEVNAYSNAAMGGMAAGDVALELNGRTLVRIPQYVYGPEPTPDPITGEVGDWPQTPIGIDPAVVTPVVTDPATLHALLDQPLQYVITASPASMATASPDLGIDHGLWVTEWNQLRGSIPYVAAGIVLLFGAAWLLASGRAGAGVRDLAYPFGLAIAAPFLLLPLLATWSPYGVGAYSVLMPLMMLPLAAGLAGRIGPGPERTLVAMGSVAAAGGAIAIGLARLTGPAGVEQAVPIAVLAGMVTFLPGLAAAARARADRATLEPGIETGVVRASALAVLGTTPMFAINSAIGPYPLLLAFWLAIALIAARFTVRPLARLASRAQLQRDLVVAATEAERARVAADIHDDALQELTLLVRRLDANGDAEGAAMARGISDRLRAICGDLRLPILDDLGVGPALDWLVLRIERLAGGEVRLERSDGTRPPSAVELAFFRVAQEALANAVKHGATPIVVRYRATEGGVSLSVDDAGPGIEPQAGEAAEREGHFGLMNMQQRADAIGAILDVRRWPTGGTHVQLEWRPR